MFTTLQKLWLHVRGGRTVNNIVYISGLPYIEMRDGKKKSWYPVRVPEDKDIYVRQRKTKYGIVIYHLPEPKKPI